MKRLVFIFTLICFLTTRTVWAQQSSRLVTGFVLNEQQRPLPKVDVKVYNFKGPSAHTLGDGSFSVNVPLDVAYLILFYEGDTHIVKVNREEKTVKVTWGKNLASATAINLSNIESAKWASAYPDIRIDEPVGPTTTTNDDPNKIYINVDTRPEFEGGDAAFKKYIEKNLKYPEIARENGVTGRVFVLFTVEKDGSISSPETVRKLGLGCDEEALRLIKESPKWRPGYIGGKPVRVQIAYPIVFTLPQ